MKNVLIFILVLLTACNKLSDIEYADLTLYKKFNYQNQLKLDGIYLSKKSLNSNICYLYKDGNIFFAKNEFDFKMECFNNIARNTPWQWGFFDIIGIDMKIQRVNSVSIQSNSKYQIDNYMGKFLNDTTFIINSVKYYNEDTELFSDTFSYKYCINKPDSMNIILENIGR